MVEPFHPEGVVTKTSPHPFNETVARLTGILAAKGLTLFTIVDHSAEARRVGLDMPDTKLVIFGSPVAGTPVMTAAPLAALDLPLKILVWTDTGGTVSISYNSAEYLGTRYDLTGELRARLEPIESLAAATIAD